MRFKFIATACMLFAICLLPTLLWAQPGGGGPDPDPSVPIDGGLSLLVAAGIGYAAKKRHDKKKAAKLEEEKEIV
ncbi:MAG: hypothetical protein ABI151_07720 [Chitinophagaceae bacterium]